MDPKCLFFNDVHESDVFEAVHRGARVLIASLSQKVHNDLEKVNDLHELNIQPSPVVSIKPESDTTPVNKAKNSTYKNKLRITVGTASKPVRILKKSRNRLEFLLFSPIPMMYQGLLFLGFYALCLA